MVTEAPDWIPSEPSELDAKLGIRIVDWDPQRLVARMPVEGNRQPYGLLHGGATCSLVELIGSYAAALSAGPDAQVVGIELTASYHRAATSGEVSAVCTPAGTDASLPVRTFDIEVFDDSDRLTSTARLTCMVLAGRDRPAAQAGSSPA